jgi:hypothetical protein
MLALVLAILVIGLRTTGAALAGTESAKPRRTISVELGGGAVSALSADAEFDRTNPAMFGSLLIEQSRPGSTFTVGAELGIGGELAGDDDRGGFGYILGGGRVGLRLARNDRGPRLWAALRVGTAGYTTTQFSAGSGIGLDVALSGAFGLATSADVVLASPAHDSLLDEDVSAALVVGRTVHIVGPKEVDHRAAPRRTT